MFIHILCSPRTRSSMVAQIFYRHGAWIPDEDASYVNEHGYRAFENRAVKRIARAQWLDYNRNRIKAWGHPMVPTERHLKNMRDIDIPMEVKTWMFKGIPEHYPLFLQFRPCYVFISRDENEAVASMVRKTHASSDVVREIHRRRMQLMSDIQHDYGGAWVSTDALLHGDFREVVSALEYCGFTPDMRLINQSVERRQTC